MTSRPGPEGCAGVTEHQERVWNVPAWGSSLGGVPEDEHSWHPGERTVCGAGEGLGVEGVLSGA